MCEYKLKFKNSKANYDNNNFKMLHDEYFPKIPLCRVDFFSVACCSRIITSSYVVLFHHFLTKVVKNSF